MATALWDALQRALSGTTGGAALSPAVAAYAPRLAGAELVGAARPTDTAQLAVLVAACRQAACPIIPWGAGTKQGCGAAPTGPALVLDLSRLCGLVELNAENLSAVFWAGTPLARVNALLAPAGLFYPVADPHPEATLGGHLAANSSGPFRLAYGTARDWVLGLEIVDSAGRVLRTGAQTVKNVAGYDLTRLMIGAWGTLAVLTRAIVRLLPAPEGRVTVAARFASAAELLQALGQVLTSPLEPAAAGILGPGANAAHLPFPLAPGEVALAVSLVGDPAGLPRRLAAVRAHLGATARAIAPAEEELWDDVRRLGQAPAPGAVRLRLGVPAAALAAAWDALHQRLAAFDPVAWGHAGSGLIYATLPPGVATGAAAAALAGLRGDAEGRLGYLAVEWAPPALAARIPLVAPRSHDPLQISLRQTLDPGRLFNPHR